MLLEAQVQEPAQEPAQRVAARAVTEQGLAAGMLVGRQASYPMAGPAWLARQTTAAMARPA